MINAYTEEQRQFLLKYGADLPTADLTVALNNKFNSNHSAASVRTFSKRLGVRKSDKHYAAIRCKNGQPLGSIRIINGYKYIKVDFSNGGFYKNWRREIDIEYEKAYGNIPNGYMVVTLDNNKLNASPQNLCAIPKSVAARMVNRHGKSFWSEFPEVTKTAIRLCELADTISRI